MAHRNQLWQPDLSHLLVGLAIAVAVFAYALVFYFCFERNTALARNWIASHLAWVQMGEQGRPAPANRQ